MFPPDLGPLGFWGGFGALLFLGLDLESPLVLGWISSAFHLQPGRALRSHPPVKLGVQEAAINPVIDWQFQRELLFGIKML